MSSYMRSFFECLPFLAPKPAIRLTQANPSIINEKTTLADTQKAEQILNAIFDASTNKTDLAKKVNTIIGADGWKENIAESVLNGIQIALEEEATMGETMQVAFDKAVAAALEFPREHPVYFAVITIGVFALLLPWALDALGFAEIGIIEGSFAARWQTIFTGCVPKGSLFSFLQRLGMKLRWT